MNKSIFGAVITMLVINVSPLVGYNDTSLEVRAAGFYPSSSRFKDIYDEVGMCYEIEATTKIHPHVNGWFNFDWYSKNGRTSGLQDPTKVTIDNISFGIRLPYKISDKFVPYIGIGPSFARVRLKNKSPCPNFSVSDEHVKKWATGGVLKTGIYCNLRSDLFLNIFMDYLYLPVHFEDRIDAGGLKAGIGIGARF